MTGKDALRTPVEDPRHWPNLRQLERTAAAIGQRLVISLEPISHTKKSRQIMTKRDNDKPTLNRINLCH